jgi:hypothetical protein
MPSFCSGDYEATIHINEKGIPYIDKADNGYNGCRDLCISKPVEKEESDEVNSVELFSVFNIETSGLEEILFPDVEGAMNNFYDAMKDYEAESIAQKDSILEIVGAIVNDEVYQDILDVIGESFLIKTETP